MKDVFNPNNEMRLIVSHQQNIQVKREYGLPNTQNASKGSNVLLPDQVLASLKMRT